MAAINFERSLKPLLVHEGGNDDDPYDPGGRTSRGITQSEYDQWRFERGLAKRDVWTADDSEVRQIYYTDYWQRMKCDYLPAGLDYAVFDFGVNSGTGRSATALQGIVRTKKDGEIGPQTIAAVREQDGASIIIELCDGRLSWLQGLKNWPRYGKGWGTRVKDVKMLALQMAGDTKSQPDEHPAPLPNVVPIQIPGPPPIVVRQPDDPGLPDPPRGGFFVGLAAWLKRLFT